MKNLISKLSLTLLLFAFSVLHATETDLLPNFQIKVVESNAFVLEFNKSYSDLSIEIKDASDNILTTKKVAKNKGVYNVKFILSEFEVGTYRLIIEDDTKITSTNIFKTKKWIELDETETILYKPYFQLTGQKLDVNLLNLEQKNVEISILDKNDDKVYSYKANGQKSIHKRFDISALEKTCYMVKVKVGDQNFYKKIYTKWCY